MIHIPDIQKAVAEYFNITLAQMLSRHRHTCYSHPRMVAMALCRELTWHSYPAIGKCFGRDHTTVMHAVGWLAQNPKMQPYVWEIKTRLAAMGGGDYTESKENAHAMDRKDVSQA